MNARRSSRSSSDAAARLQSQLIAFLLRPGSYAHRPRRVRLVQTHASLVFIAPPYVYKIKRPVNFGFLDFSTLGKRHADCEREVALNRRLSPDAYIGVVPISKRRGGFVLGDTRHVVEYAVQMHQFTARDFLDHQLERGVVGVRELDRVADVLERFYRQPKPGSAVRRWGTRARIRQSTDENFQQLEPHIGRTLSAATHAALKRYTASFFQQHGSLFARRVREGRILDCHGDLHLEHIHVTPRAVQIYDCIEFNERFRFVDVANDIAFLAMDLDFRNRPDLASHLVRRLARGLADPDLLKLLDFYKCYRAIVRGKVETFHSLAPTAPAKEQRASAARARQYFRLALQYALAGSAPLLVVCLGRIASGKSTLAAALAEVTGWAVHSSDAVRKSLAGQALFERGDEQTRGRLYSRAATQRTYRALQERADQALHAGHSVILDATFGRREQRDLLRAWCQRQGFRYCFVEVVASDALTRQRLRGREGRTDVVSDARLEDFQQLSAAFEAPVELSKTESIRVRSTADVSVALKRVLMELAARRGGEMG